MSPASALNLSYGKELTHYQTTPHFDALRYIAVVNNVKKGEISCNKQYLLFLLCFLPYMTLHFKCTLKCRLQLVHFGIV